MARHLPTRRVLLSLPLLIAVTATVASSQGGGAYSLDFTIPLDPAGSWQIDPVWHLPWIDEFDPEPALADADARVVLRDAAGGQLFSQLVARRWICNGSCRETDWASAMVPAQPQAHTVELHSIDAQGGAVELKAARERSAARPVIEILSPKPGGTLEDGSVIEWRGTDADGDELVYDLLYRPGTGYWQQLPLKIRTQQTRYVFKREGLPADDNATIAVVANDGFNTVEETVTGLRIEGNLPPEVRITSPRDGEHYNYRSNIILLGYVDDAEDGQIPDDRIQWLSDRDGVVGDYSLNNWSWGSRGRHVLTLRATDSAGVTAEDTVTIYIGVSTPNPPPLNAIFLPLALASFEGVPGKPDPRWDRHVAFERKLLGESPFDRFGSSLAAASDGSTLIVGAPGSQKHGYDTGSAVVYVRDARGRWRVEQRLYGETYGRSFGSSVGLSADGRTVLVGAPSGSAFEQTAGRAHVFVRAGGSWHKRHTFVGDSPSDLFGRSVALSSDGRLAIVGATLDDDGEENAGAAYVFARDDTDAWRQQAKLTGDAPSDWFGLTVELTAGGALALVGEPRDDEAGPDAGAVHLFDRDAGWSAVEKLLGTEPGERFGYDVAASTDGDTLVVGTLAQGLPEQRRGAAYIMVLARDGKWEVAHRLVGDVDWSGLGRQVAVSPSGDLVTASAYSDIGTLPGAGAVRVAAPGRGGEWTQQLIVGQRTDVNLGASLAVGPQGVDVFLGAPSDRESGPDAGAVLVFRRVGLISGE